MNKSFLLLAFVVSYIFVGCGGSYVLKEGVQLTGYKYAIVSPLTYQGGADDIFGLRVKLINKFIKKGFQVIESDKVSTLQPNEMGSVLMASINHRQSYSGIGGKAVSADLTIVIHDIEGVKIFQGNGTANGSIFESEEGTLGRSLDDAFSFFESLYVGYNPTHAVNIVKNIQMRYNNWERINKTHEELKKYFDENTNSLDPIEGIWADVSNNQYQIAIIREKEKKTRDFVAVIINADSVFWVPGQVKADFQKTAYKTAYTTNWYMRDHSKQGTTVMMKDKGMFEFELRNPQNSNLMDKATYIKNYPNSDNDISSSDNSSNVKSTGSGFLITNSGMVVTNWHVVKESNSIDVFFPKTGVSFIAEVLLKDVSNDIAILRIKEFELHKVSLDSIPYTLVQSKNSKIGQEVYTLGFPLGDILGKSAKLTNGTINSLYGIKDDPRLFQISTPIQPGNSGGPLFNSNGELIGIIVSSLNAKFFYENLDLIPQNVNFAIKGDYLLNLISMLPEGDLILKKQNKLEGKKLDMQIEEITPFIVNVKSK